MGRERGPGVGVGRAQAEPPVNVGAPSGVPPMKEMECGGAGPTGPSLGHPVRKCSGGLGVSVESSRPSPPGGSGPWAECT